MIANAKRFAPRQKAGFDFLPFAYCLLPSVWQRPAAVGCTIKPENFDTVSTLTSLAAPYVQKLSHQKVGNTSINLVHIQKTLIGMPTSPVSDLRFE
jgi:hypothetical protein